MGVMAHLLRLEKGGSTLDLVGDTNIIAMDYTPQAPELSVAEYTDNLRDGGEVTGITRRNVTETCEILLNASTAGDLSDVQEYINQIENWIRSAEEKQRRRAGDPVYVEFTPHDSTGLWRSEILAGSVEINEIYPRWLARTHVQIIIYWTRRFYWEGAEAELSLTNGNGTGTGGIIVNNCNDATRDNWIDINGVDVEGVIPAACRIEIENTYNNIRRLYNLYIGHNVWSNPASMSSILEGENADAGGSSVVAATCSGGYYQSVTSVGETQALALRWELSTAMLNAFAGGWFRLLGRIISTSTNTKLQAKVTFPSGTPLTPVAEAAEVTLGSNYIQDLGVLQLPPWLRGETGLYPVDLTLYARREGGSGSFSLDFIQLTPLDSYRVLTPRGYGAAYGVTVVDDGIMNSLYTTGWDISYKTGHYMYRGEPIMLWPARDQRLYILGTSDVGSSAVERTYSVRVYYRPRRLTL